jgi:hypothetical protein
MKIFNLLFAFLFLVAAILQYNDPDPYVWIPIYMYGAVLCWLAFRGRYFPQLCILGAIAFFGYSLYFFFTENGVLDWIRQHNAENIAETMKAEKPWIEDTREFFGLIILVVVLLINYVHGERKLRKAALSF